MTPRVTWLQHARHEGLGSIGPWLARRGIEPRAVALWDGAPLPRVGSFDWLVVMGGPMNVEQQDKYPWLGPEKELIRDACVKKSAKVLGICLGAQLVAAALGARTRRNEYREIGWFDVMINDEGRRSRYFGDFPDTFESFHWHADTFDIPDGARNLMSSQGCRHQAFAWGQHVLALQYHLEVTPEDVATWYDLGKPAPDRFVQTRAAAQAEPGRFDAGHRWLRSVLERFLT